MYILLCARQPNLYPPLHYLYRPCFLAVERKRRDSRHLVLLLSFQPIDEMKNGLVRFQLSLMLAAVHTKRKALGYGVKMVLVVSEYWDFLISDVLQQQLFPTQVLPVSERWIEQS
jgi:hypothetical protein